MLSDLKIKIFTTVFFSFLISVCFSQKQISKERFKIIWVKEISSGSENSNEDLVKKTLDFITGKKEAGLKSPMSLVADKNNNLWVTDRGMFTVMKIKENTVIIPKAFKKSKQNFSSLVDICIAFDNRIFFTDSHLNNIYGFDDSKNTPSVFCKKLNLKQPTGIAYSEITKEIWVAETEAHRISVFNKKGERIKTIGKRGKNPGEFNFPTFISIDKNGNVYVVDALNFRVQIFDKSGNLINVFGEYGDGTGNFARPKGIATDSYGNIYVTDALFHTVQIFDKSGGFLYSFGEQGREKGQFWMPAGIFIDKKDYIYVADSYNSRIQIFKLVKN